MQFTIAIPAYNSGGTIEKTIKSALNQDFDQPYEILVSNNGSSDNTRDILLKYSDKISIVERTDTVPMYQNHNICLSNSKGKYVIFCHADDTLTSSALSTYLTILKNRNFPTNYILWGRSMFRDFYENWKLSGLGLNHVLSGQSSIIPFLSGGLTPSGVCYSKESLIGMGGFCSATMRLTPFDITTMLKVAINGGEFEMVDRLFFIRKFASTAVEQKQTKQLTRIYSDSMVDGFNCLKNELRSDDYSYLMNSFKLIKSFNYNVYKILLCEKKITKSIVFKRILVHIFKNPSLITNRIFRYQVILLLSHSK